MLSSARFIDGGSIRCGASNRSAFPNPTRRELVIVRLLPTLLLLALYSPSSGNAGDWSQEQIPKLPTGETPVQLFNGKDLDGWVGHIGKYFSVEDGHHCRSQFRRERSEVEHVSDDAEVVPQLSTDLRKPTCHQ